ncbi:hypothetical protein N1851_010876 [Merluccius polli]|uniref:TTC3/DZIP3-like helical domain-containing protein n=1 Tax=Merluccius polli TaxID=89951 RepID=A0AA47MZ80_MERPO|nr:hypothetical protein N1851_010876 [Merluccius polli]
MWSCRYPPQVMAIFQHRWRSCIKEATEKILMVESQYQEQKEQLKKGTRLSSLPHVSAPCAPEPPVALTFSSIQKFSFGEVPQARYADLPSARDPAPDQHRANMQAQPCGPSLAQAPIHPPAIQRNRPLEPQQTTRFDRILEQLGSMFPDYNK